MEEILFYYNLCFASAYLCTFIICAHVLLSNIWIVEHTSPRLVRLVAGFVTIIGALNVLSWFITYSIPGLSRDAFFDISSFLDCVSFISFIWIGEVLCHPDRISYKYVLTRFMPMVFLLLVLCIVNHNWSHLVIYYVSLAYALVMIARQWISIRRHDQRLILQYAELEPHRHTWFMKIMGLLLVQMLLYISWSTIEYFGDLYHEADSIVAIIYDLLGVFIWIRVVSHIVRLKHDDVYDPVIQVDADANEDVVSEDDSYTDSQSENNAPWIERMDYIMHHDRPYLQQDFSLLKLAALSGTNRTYLSEYFNRTLHTNFYTYVNDIRLEYIDELMQDTSLDLSHIAAMSGFSDIRTFRKLFMDRFSCTPRDYRKGLLAKKNSQVES